MKRTQYVAFLSCLAISLSFFTSKAQTKAILFDGIIIAGYVDHGAYINCTGPAVKFSKKPYMLAAGLLPGLRIKEDKVAPGLSKNSLTTPSLGFGLTAAFKHLAVQIPLYYNAKTTAKNGEWNLGFGLGYKL